MQLFVNNSVQSLLL